MISFWIHIAEQNAFAVLDVLWWLAAMRVAKKTVWRVLVCVFMAAQLSAALLVADGADLSLYIPTPALLAVVVWHFFGLPLLTGLGVLWACIRLMRRRQVPVQTPPAPASPVQNSISRRNFLGACAALAPPLFTFGITGIAQSQLDLFRLRRFTLSLPSLPKPLDGLTIAQVSDIHVGQWTHGPVLKKIVNTTNSLDADLVVVTGDLIDYELSDLTAAIDVVKQMHGRHGLCVIEGNHDLIENGGVFEERVKHAGLSLLLDESVFYDVRGYPVQLLGLRWMDCVGTRSDNVTSWQVRELAKQRRPEAFPIFLAHHPAAFDAAIENGLPLTLSGHTHGGQIMLDRHMGVGPALFRYWSGLYKRGESQLIVSNGVGNTFPIRINAPAEIVHITLRCGVA